MILHVDMDAFYASVEERERPELRGHPVVVGGSPEGRGVVAAANYVARKYGVRSAMPAAQAKRLCPQAIFVRSRMGLYVEESARIRKIFARFTPLIEPLSLDEAFLDVSGCERLFGSARDIALAVKRDIANETALVASVGIAPTKFVAKIASDFDKPDGLVCVEADEVQAFLDTLPIGALWGVGRATGSRFAQMGVETIGELREQPREMLSELFGRHGEHLWRLSHGVDPRSVTPERAAKSISHETTFSHDIFDLDELCGHLHQLIEQVSARLRRTERVARRVQLKIRFDDFRTITRASSFETPTDSTRAIRQTARGLLERNVVRRPGTRILMQPLRLLGAGVAGFEPHPERTQGDLFDGDESGNDQAVDSLVDAIRGRFGEASLRRGHRPR